MRGTVRSVARIPALPNGVEGIAWDLEADDVPGALVRGASVVIHLAGRAHRMDSASARDVAAYHRINVDATRALLQAARAHGVPRFVYVSSVKVLGEGEASPYRADAAVAPRDAYARSKAEAEAIVQREAGPVRWTIVRPAFVYGASGRGNFVRLLKLARVAARIPLPLSAIRNRRSVVYVENLADLLAFCAESARMEGRIVPGVDAESVSTPMLVRAVARSMGLSARLFPLPSSVLAVVARLAGRGADWHRLAGDFEVDTSVLREVGWSPPVSFDESFRRSAAAVVAGAPV